MISIYTAAVLAVIYMVLTVNVILVRRAVKSVLGDAGNEQLQRAIRVHGNFSEFVPLSLILLYLTELHVMPETLANTVIVTLTAITLIAGRLLHAYGVRQMAEKIIYRQLGMFCTFASLYLPAGFILLHPLF